jgi:hypothetical protein
LRPSCGRTDYFWAGDDLLAEAREGALTEYAMWGFVAEALWENGQLRQVVNSQQGVAQELIDQNGKLVWQGTFDDWGKLIAETGVTTCRLRLPGQVADDETGLHYNRFRYYSPERPWIWNPMSIEYNCEASLGEQEATALVAALTSDTFVQLPGRGGRTIYLSHRLGSCARALAGRRRASNEPPNLCCRTLGDRNRA